MNSLSQLRLLKANTVDVAVPWVYGAARQQCHIDSQFFRRSAVDPSDPSDRSPRMHIAEEDVRGCQGHFCVGVGGSVVKPGDQRLPGCLWLGGSASQHLYILHLPPATSETLHLFSHRSTPTQFHPRRTTQPSNTNS
jgi:hypothetical protein